MFIAFIHSKNQKLIEAYNDGEMPSNDGEKYYFVHLGNGQPNRVLTDDELIEFLDDTDTCDVWIGYHS